ncbi:VOC family protein [Alteraurantiacibacter aestuarii]|uniref:VOC family protein n=1 Tax=Alteraurantiacibacter aestuarii TaxID=650004 RepID=A0A844ZT92_9SPHN|nr:VOC family protein [Alteraurantiacibacter aestuarii]MXO88789.1 VOC family protein [Alteraurantiacibacter aestuarii]
MQTMMGFGRPTKTVIQTAFVVEDLAAALHYYTRTLNIGPFFTLPHRTAPGRIYRGMESLTESSLAMGFVGNMQIELIQQHDDAPSLFKEAVEAEGYGFHHYGVVHDDVEAVLPAYYGEGYELVGSTPVPTGGTVVFLQSPDPVHRGYLELIPYTEAMDEMFTRYWQAAQGWDGTDPVRDFG